MGIIDMEKQQQKQMTFSASAAVLKSIPKFKSLLKKGKKKDKNQHGKSYPTLPDAKRIVASDVSIYEESNATQVYNSSNDNSSNSGSMDGSGSSARSNVSSNNSFNEIEPRVSLQNDDDDYDDGINTKNDHNNPNTNNNTSHNEIEDLFETMTSNVGDMEVAPESKEEAYQDNTNNKNNKNNKNNANNKSSTKQKQNNTISSSGERKDNLPNTLTSSLPSSISDKRLKELKQIFDHVDRDGDGSINVRELVLGLRNEPKLSELLNLPKHIQQKSIDGTRGGQEEFEKVFQKMMNQNDSERKINFQHFANQIIQNEQEKQKNDMIQKEMEKKLMMYAKEANEAKQLLSKREEEWKHAMAAAENATQEAISKAFQVKEFANKWKKKSNLNKNINTKMNQDATVEALR